MHICYITIDYHHNRAGGGIASYVQTMSQALLARGHQVSVIAPGRTAQTETEGRLTVVQVPLGSIHWYLYKLKAPSLAVLPLREIEWSLALRRGLNHILTKHPIDIIEGCETGMQFITNRHFRQTPVIIRLHGAPYTFQKYSRQPLSWGQRFNYHQEMTMLRRVTAVTAPSLFQAGEIAADLGWPEDKIQAIPNPIAPTILKQAESQQVGNSRDTKPTVLYTGRIEYCKGTLPLLDSVPKVVQVFSQVQFVLAGNQHNSIDEQTLQQALDQDNTRDHVRLLGHIPWRDLVVWYQRATLFVMPSYYETFGISVIEAMAFGLPVVATTAGGLPEVVENGVTGLLVPPGDAQALAEAIICLLRDPVLRQRMGQAGQERVRARFTADKVVEQTLAIYQQAIN